MNWDQLQVSWKQLKGKFVFERFRAMDDNGKGLQAEHREDVEARPKRRATDGLSPRRPRQAERVFVTYRLLNRLEATRYLLTSSHDLPQRTARRALI